MRAVLEARWFKSLFGALAIVYFATSLLRFVVHPSGSHTHRQSDTIGMSMEFAQDLKERGLVALDFIAYPKILQKGLKDGINASEFPLLGFLTGPFFLVGKPELGIFISCLSLLLFNFFTAGFFLPRFLSFYGVKISGSSALLLYLATATLAHQTNVLMPEGLAFPMLLMGMTLLLEADRNRRRYFLELIPGIILCNLAIAVKPTVILGLGAYLIIARAGAIGPILASLILTLFWYAFHVKAILAFAQGPQIFAQAQFSPVDRLREVGFSRLGLLMSRETFNGQFPMFTGWLWIACAVWKKEWKIILAYVVALVAAIALDGNHIIFHSYYFIGTSFFALILIARVLAETRNHSGLHLALTLTLIWGAAYSIRENVWTWARDSDYFRKSQWETAEKARALIPKTAHLVTDDGPYPLKLLLIGRSGTNSGTFALKQCEQAEYKKLELAIVRSSPKDLRDLPNFLCGRLAETHLINTPYDLWSVTLLPAAARETVPAAE